MSELFFLFFTTGNSQANYFHIFPVFVLSYDNWLPAEASYLQFRHKSGINLLSNSQQETK